MIDFIDSHREQHGVEPICQPLPLSVSTDYWHKAREIHPEKIAKRSKRDQQLIPEIQRVWDENHQVYGARKVWKQLQREQINVARCTVERLMKQLDLQGVSRAPVSTCTTVSDADHDKPQDKVNRQFVADHPNPAMGGRSDIRCYLVWFCLCGFHHRRVFPLHCWLAGESVTGNQPGTGCAGTGHLAQKAGRETGSSFRSWGAISVDPLYRAAG